MTGREQEGGLTDTTVFPVGHGAGPFVPAEPTIPSHHVVRVGRRSEHLTEDEFRSWFLAHRPGQLRRERYVDDLIHRGVIVSPHLTEEEFRNSSVAHRPGPPPREQHVGELLRRGLLVEVTDPMSFAQRYRLMPLFLGLGNSPDDLDRYAIGVPGLEPLATVGSSEFELWQWGWVAPSLWAHCEVLATIGEQEGHGPSTPDDHLEVVLRALPALLAGFVAFLEPVHVRSFGARDSSEGRRPLSAVL